MSDLMTLFACEDKTRRWRAESENAHARLELAKVDENIARIISQSDPLAYLGLDRNRVRLLLRYVRYGDLGRLQREFDEVVSKEQA